MVMQNKPLSLKKNMMWNAIGSTVYLACQWLCTMLAVRLSPNDLTNAGLLSLAMSVAAIFVCVATFSMRAFQVSDDQFEYADGVYIAARLGLFVAALMAAAMFAFINPYTHIQRAAISLYMLFKISEALSDVLGGAAQRRERMDIEGKSFILRGVLGTLAFGFTLYWTGSMLWAMVAMAAACYLVVLLYQASHTRAYCDIRPLMDKARVTSLIRACTLLFIGSILYNSIVSVPRLFLESIHGADALAIYASVATPTLLVQMLCAYIYNPLLTRFTKLYRDGNREAFSRLMLICIGVMLVVVALALVVAYFLGAFGIGLLYGKEMVPYKDLLYLMILNTGLTAAMWFLSTIAIVIRRIKGLIVASVLGMVLCCLLSALLIPSLSMDGASLSGILAQAAEVGVLGVYLAKVLKGAKTDG